MIYNVVRKQNRIGRRVSFCLAPKDLGKWMHQNDAEYTGDFADGVLLDSFMVSTRTGYAAIYEHYVNCWQSDYRIEYMDCDATELFQEFQKWRES